ncbi:class I SAM-dependent methyltransferase [Pseudothauera nasutitermitis]|uniref:Class I SAM-dependent methyltransferase n=1 Tax=Pseudothauera nasutitermitis TaxID=2565930 RepID=A0A4V3WBN7_9RHOO|nr:class I SAM-dependent methyltransferase [Pseudothauera nasutitermitis]THF63953.1 class I SAM-dependent methyltransferase [Pseudothauera nasutitermitis]
MSLAAIDFGRLYRDHLAAAKRNPKPASVWDARAAELGRKALKSRYVDEFIGRMDLAGARTLLDVGCGPGTICLPLAGRLERVIGLDFSRGMLDALQENAAGLELDNVEALQLAWEDDWAAVPACDIVVASRSTTVADLEVALHKLNDKAKRRVYLTHLVGGRFIDDAVIEAVGRDLPALPDYIYAVNILHGMGIHPRLDYIASEGRLTGATDFDEFAAHVAWALGELSAAERERLHAWYLRQPAPSLGAPMRWAFISWDKQPD